MKPIYKFQKKECHNPIGVNLKLWAIKYLPNNLHIYYTYDNYI